MVESGRRNLRWRSIKMTELELEKLRLQFISITSPVVIPREFEKTQAYLEISIFPAESVKVCVGTITLSPGPMPRSTSGR